MNKAIVLANGQFPKRNEALQAILQMSLLVCCDGAYDKLVASGLFSHSSHLPQIYVVGDGDSQSTDVNRPLLPNTTFVKEYTDQDTNDLTKAVKHTLSLGVERMIILGATGLREDHTLGNISLLAQYVDMKNADGKPVMVRMYTDYGIFTPIVETTVFTSFARQQVSLFALSSDVRLTSEGLRYPLQGRKLQGLWEATLNEALGEQFTITVEGQGVTLVYQTHEAK